MTDLKCQECLGTKPQTEPTDGDIIIKRMTKAKSARDGYVRQKLEAMGLKYEEYNETENI